MANIIPAQVRAVDPFASFYSNTVNKLTQLVTHDEEGLLTTTSMDVIPDATNSTHMVVVQPGYVVKDNVLIKITHTHIVDFLDDDNWVSPPDILFPGGTCYLVLHYLYQKQRPAPVATIQILQPSQRNALELPNSPHFLLKVVELTATAPHEIIGLYDYDPNPDYKDIKRKFLKYYAGGEAFLPDHNQQTDQGRMAYDVERNKFFFGYTNEWKELSVGGVEVGINTDSTGIITGQLCYVNNNGKATPAISTSVQTGADLIVTAIGTTVDGTGKGIITGFATGVPVETGVLIGVGDLLYLSETEAGTVTNIRPGSLFQMVGRALKSASSFVPVEMIFDPKMMLAPSTSGTITYWGGPVGGPYYAEIDVSMLDGTSVFDCHWFDAATNKEVTPADVEIRNGGNIIRVYSDDNTIDLNYMIQSPESFGGGSGGGGGGGGGGTSDHSLLLNLDYGASGHTGFLSTYPHDNTYHSQSYIGAGSVNFSTLNGNGSVGAGGSQVAVGNHTHAQYIDIPSGICILFNANTAVSGYNLVTGIDDGVVYITKGSAAGGEAGANWKVGGQWEQPAHVHGIYGDGHHNHTTGDVTLTVAQMPSHTHGPGYPLVNFMGSSGPGIVDSVGTSGDDYSATTATAAAGGNQPHNHGWTSATGTHYHTGAVTAGGTPLSWRPKGWNMTLQCRI